MVDKATDTEQGEVSSEGNYPERRTFYHDEQENCVQDKFKLVFIVSLFFLALSLVAVASILAWAYVEREHNLNDKAQLHEPTRLYSSPAENKIQNSTNFRPQKALHKGDEEQRSSIPDDGNENMHLYRVYDAINKGAVCLDGTPPAYYLRPGKGLGLNRWIIHFNGGAWCFDEKSCLERSRGSLGSTKHLPKAPPVIQGINSPNGQLNPDFYDWNLVWIVYCDGASFTGDRAEPVVVGGENIFFRGKRVLDAVISDLVNRGVLNAEGIILTGSSAGSMTAMFAVDRFAEQLPNVPMHVLSDAGYFIETQPMGGKNVGGLFKKVYDMQNSSAGLNTECIRSFGKEMGWKCFLPQHTFKFIKHPVFILNAAYDVWALLYFVGIDCKFPTVAAPVRKRRSAIEDSDLDEITARDRKQNRDVSGFEITPYFRAVSQSGTEVAKSSLTEKKNIENNDGKRYRIPGTDSKVSVSNQEKRNYDSQVGSLDIYNNLGVFPSPDYMINSRLGDANQPENSQDVSIGNSLHLNIDKGEGKEFAVPSFPVVNGVQAAPSNARQDEMNINPLASSVDTLNSVANKVQKNRMDKDTMGLLNEVFKKLTKMMPKNLANKTTLNKVNNTAAATAKQKVKPNGPSLMKNLEYDKLLASQPHKDSSKHDAMNVSKPLGLQKAPGQQEHAHHNNMHNNTMAEMLKQAKKIQQAMKPNKPHPLHHETELQKSHDNPHIPKSRDSILKLFKNKRSTSIVKEYINILRSDPPECTENQLIHVMQYRGEMLKATSAVTSTQSAGLFLVSCIQHSLSLFDETWTGVTVKQKSIQQAFGDWYYGRGTNHYSIDGVYPSNPSCP